MIGVLLKKWVNQLASTGLHCVEPLYHIREMSLAATKNKLDKALEVIDLIAPKERSYASQECHLRLIQSFLERDTSNSILCNANDFNKEIEIISTSKEDGISLHMDTERLKIDANVLSYALSSCANRRSLGSGIQLHSFVIKTGQDINVYIGSSLISLYIKCGQLENAYKAFEEIPEKNVVSWTTVIAGFAQEWHVEVCLDLYYQMRISMSKPNDFTFTSLLSACTGTGALGHGRSVHCQTIRTGFDSYVQISNALVSMYCKCGDIKAALYIFQNMTAKDVVSWNSMITGYAQYGLALQAIDLFEEMKKQTIAPDTFTFLGILSSCRHAGLVTQGQLYFNSMVEYGVKPEVDHYSCVVDLLGRAGLLEEARDFIEKMPMYPTAMIWGSLLSSCRFHGNTWVGIQAAESKLLLEPECAATHLQLANLYAGAGCWAQAAKVRKFMKDKGLKTNLGYSWIEIKNGIYRFRAEEGSNSKFKEILGVLDSLGTHMRTSRSIPMVHEIAADTNSYPFCT